MEENKMMKKFIACLVACISLSAFAVEGPTAIGGAYIGMSKAEYLSVIGSTPPTDCNKPVSDGKVTRLPMKNLTVERKTLCITSYYKKAATIENIQLGDISYDVVEADNASSKFINSIGDGSKAIFLKDKLISVEIYEPKVVINELVEKYGRPKMTGQTKTEICTNYAGNQVKNKVGKIEAVWMNGNVRAIFRKETETLRAICTDGVETYNYLIEERKQMEAIESAIMTFQRDLRKEAGTESKF